MKERVAEDQGAVEAINRAVYASCAALIWHQGLGGDALAMVEGRVLVPSKVIGPLGSLQQCRLVQVCAYLAVLDTSAVHLPSSLVFLYVNNSRRLEPRTPTDGTRSLKGDERSPPDF